MTTDEVSRVVTKQTRWREWTKRISILDGICRLGARLIPEEAVIHRSVLERMQRVSAYHYQSAEAISRRGAIKAGSAAAGQDGDQENDVN